MPNEDQTGTRERVVCELRSADGELKARHDSATSTDAATTTQKESK